MPEQAHELSKKRHRGPPNKIDLNPDLNKFVLEGLAKGRSREQISGRMLRIKKDFYACHESIYRYVYRNKEQGFYKLLHRKKPYRCFKKIQKAHQKARLLKRIFAIYLKKQNYEIYLVIGKEIPYTLRKIKNHV